MKPKRVECNQCQNFIEPEFKEDGNLISPIIKKAKCRLSKRVMFRLPNSNHCGYALDFGGYFRYCNDFKQNEINL